jgi:hypothetical protein
MRFAWKAINLGGGARNSDLLGMSRPKGGFPLIAAVVPN